MEWIIVVYQLVFFYLMFYVVLDLAKDIYKKNKREKKLKKENRHTHDEIFGLGVLLNDKEKGDAEKVRIMKEILNILDDE